MLRCGYMPEKLIDTAEVMRRLSCGRTQLHFMVRDGRFPEPIRIGRMRRWREAVVDAWIVRQSGEDARGGDSEPARDANPAAGGAL